MILLTVATENEIKPLQHFLAAADRVEVLVTGMGPVRAAASLGSCLGRRGGEVVAVVNIGVAGAYVDSGPDLLDICLAQQEFLGDFGICMPDKIQDFSPELTKGDMPMLFNKELISGCADRLQDHDVACKTVNFVTVNCASGSRRRGDLLRDKFAAGCENMEGAAVAMVCNAFNIPCVEMRCVSNMVLDRDVSSWKLNAAIEKICRAAEVVLSGLLETGTFATDKH